MRAAARTGGATIDLPAIAQRARTYDDYASRLAEEPSEHVELVGLALFGERDAVAKLTGALRLLR